MTKSSVLAFVLYLLTVFSVEADKETSAKCTRGKDQSLYDFTTKYLDGTPVSLSKYRGKVTLVINVATYCGFTHQYPSLNALMRTFTITKHKCGFSVLAFPCNQFLYQEPGANALEIFTGLRFVRPGYGYVPNFPLFQKTEVNGARENPIYTFLKSRCPIPGGVISQHASTVTWSPVRSDDISWNFEKVLVDHQGFPVKRYLPSTKPFDLVHDILGLINNC